MKNLRKYQDLLYPTSILVIVAAVMLIFMFAAKHKAENKPQDSMIVTTAVTTVTTSTPSTTSVTTTTTTTVTTTETTAVTTTTTTTLAPVTTTAKRVITTVLTTPVNTTVTITSNNAVTEPVVTTPVSAGIPEGLTEAEYIMICNCVAYEYGSNWVSEYEKGKVVEVIMNRVHSDRYPNTIYGVLTQPRQFSGVWNYINLGTYSKKVTQSVKDAVNLYFSNPSAYNHGYTRFEGDGTWNYFS